MPRSRSWLVVAATLTLCATTLVAHASNLSLDPTYSGDGVLRLKALDGAETYEVEVLGNKVYAAGIVFGSSPSQTFLARTNADGTLDGSYGVGGVATLDAPGMVYGSRSVDFTDDGSAVVTYYAKHHLVIQRWASDGSLDTKFSGDGIRQIAFATSKIHAVTRGAVDAQGRVVVAAQRDAQRGFDALIYRLTPQGALDTSFSVDGVKRLDYFKWDWVDALTVDHNNRVIFATDDTEDASTARGYLIRLKPDGSTDTNFSDDGRVGLRLAPKMFTYPLAVGVDSHNVITAALTGSSASTYGAARVLTNGDLDPDYGDAGVLGVTCACLPRHAQVVDGAVAFDGILGDLQTVVATRFSANGHGVFQGRIDLFPATTNEWIDGVALDGTHLFIGGSVGRDAYIAKID
ncbi:MAG TPA: hypothetical protein VMT88_03295 [Actinomycetes bacterium]|nr:hypothetical protein [Actinomycetes bacterium]